MSQNTHDQATSRPCRNCARAGCGNPVKKVTGKYCCVRCCSSDPVRTERLRERAQARSRHVLPMARQLNIPYDSSEQMLARLCEGREDAPLGMARLVV